MTNIIVTTWAEPTQTMSTLWIRY